jgi:hypothetical protein
LEGFPDSQHDSDPWGRPVHVEAALENLEVTRYEFLDFEVDVHTDVALVYYVARDWLNTPDGEKTILVRALDVYGLQKDGWIQIGSNICLVPDDSASD